MQSSARSSRHPERTTAKREVVKDTVKRVSRSDSIAQDLFHIGRLHLYDWFFLLLVGIFISRVASRRMSDWILHYRPLRGRPFRMTSAGVG